MKSKPEAPLSFSCRATSAVLILFNGDPICRATADSSHQVTIPADGGVRRVLFFAFRRRMPATALLQDRL